MSAVVQAAKTSSAAIWSLVLGILSLLCFGFLTGIPAVICGHTSRSNIRNSAGALTGGGMALAGLILGYIGIFITTLGILAAIIVPNFFAYKEQAFCKSVESDAMNAAAAVTCYLIDPAHVELPTLDDLAADPACRFTPSENVDLTIEGTQDQVKIIAMDNSGRCPRGSQYAVSLPDAIDDGWQ